MSHKKMGNQVFLNREFYSKAHCHAICPRALKKKTEFIFSQLDFKVNKIQ